MGRGYWLPPNCEKLICCDGFFVDVKAIAETDAEKRWNMFLDQVAKELQQKEKSLKLKKEWKAVNNGCSRFVLLCDNCVDVIAEETKGYFAIYVIIPENCIVLNLAKNCFWKYKSDLKKTLIKLYPGNVKQRKNYRQLVDIG